MVLFILLLIAAFIIAYRLFNGNNVNEFVKEKGNVIINKFAPYSFKVVNEKTKKLGQEYKFKDYLFQCIVLGGFAGVVSYVYFYDLKICILYVILAVMLVPYLAFLRSKRIYSEFLFEQVQTYTTNTIMEFATTKSFVKALEGVVASQVLEEPIVSDVKKMIEMSYQDGNIEGAIKYMDERYPYYIVKNMHQLFLQVTKEGARDTGESLENMQQDIDMLVESVYRDRIDRKAFHGQFLKFGFMLYLLAMLVQYLVGNETYIRLLDMWYMKILLHGIILFDSYFLLKGEKYYNENVGVE